MNIYARVEDGVVMEIIPPREDGLEIEKRFHPDFVATLVDITDVSPAPDQRWTYDGETFSPPAD